MNDRRRAYEVACVLSVELVTEYLEGTLVGWLQDAVTRHLAECADCREYLAQIRATISVTGRLAERRGSP